MAFAVVVGLAVGAASGQPALPENRPASAQALLEAQSKDVVEDLMSDRMVLVQGENPKPGLVEALVLFSQPVEKVWELLLQRERQKEFRPELTSITVIERSADGLTEEQHLKIAFLSVGYRLLDRFEPDTLTFTWELDPTFESPHEHGSGYWELHALDSPRTLARFGTKVSVSPAVPGFLQNGITRKNVPQTLENTRQWVDSDGRWRP
jgi:hypothetical protein